MQSSSTDVELWYKQKKIMGWPPGVELLSEKDSFDF